MLTVSTQSSTVEISTTNLHTLLTSLLVVLTGVSRQVLVGTDWQTGGDWGEGSARRLERRRTPEATTLESLPTTAEDMSEVLVV